MNTALSTTVEGNLQPPPKTGALPSDLASVAWLKSQRQRAGEPNALREAASAGRR
jgi:hypothetical protein